MIKIDKKEILFGLIGDTHIHSKDPKIPEIIINDFLEKKIDYLIHLGDFTVLEVYTKLQDIFGKEKVIGVAGNMDSLEISQKLPKNLNFTVHGYKIFITHGLGGSENIIKNLNREYDLNEYDIIIFGHVHKPYNKKWKDGKYYISPGTPFKRRLANVQSYGYIKLSNQIETRIIKI
jgi:putative phosphoesterase